MKTQFMLVLAGLLGVAGNWFLACQKSVLKKVFT